MRLAFVTPTLHTLGPRWQRDPQIVKLAAPTLAGFLEQNGWTDLRQYDFEVQIFELEAREPGRLRLQLFSDDARVDAFLRGEPGGEEIRAQAELIVDTLEIEEADVYFFSCASVLELYADMHTAGNINMSVAKVLRERFPGCRSVIGGLQISPESKHVPEYEQMLERCDALDFAVEGKGEWPILHVVEALAGVRTFEQNEQRTIPAGRGQILRAVSRLRTTYVPMGIAKQEGLRLSVLTPEEEPEGEHKRQEIINQSVYVTPYFDPKNVEKRRLSGLQILKRYQLDKEWVDRLARFEGDSVVVLPMIFMEGCNSHCTFCSYSMTKMIKRDIADAVQAIAYLREKHDVRYFHFLNTNINGYYKYAEAFADALIGAKLDILWSDCANLRALDKPLLEKLRASGLIRFTYGLECPSDKMLKYILKGITVQQAHDRLREAHELGIWNHLLLITGLPHETPDDTQYFLDFLERTNDFTHGYSISSFYLVSTSLMGAFPARYGLEMIPNPSGLLEDQAFNEVGGLTWERKKRQIIESTEIITEKIKALKVEPKYWSGAIDLELLFWLYDRLGHDAKADIVRCYEDAFIGVPAHPKAYRRQLVDLLRAPPPDLDAKLRAAGLRALPEALESRHEKLVLPLTNGADRVELTLRCHEHGDPPTLAAGRNLGASATGRPGFADELAGLVAPEGELGRTLASVGWSITERELRHGMSGVGFRIEHADLGFKLDLFVASLQAGQPAFLREGGLGFLYAIPHGAPNPSSDRRVMPFVERIGRFLLARLGKLERAQATVPLDAEALREVAEALVAALEAPRAEELAREPVHDHEKRLGRRFGPDFSKVASA